MITSIGMRAGVKNLRISLEDLSNKKTIRNILSLKEAKKKVEATAKKMGATQQPMPEQGNGLLARPQMGMEE